MKVEVESKPKRLTTYPQLMVNSKGLILYVVSEDDNDYIGMTFNHKNSDFNEMFSGGYAKSEFKLFKGSITLSND